MKLRLPTHSRYFFERSRLVTCAPALAAQTEETARVGEGVKHLRVLLRQVKVRRHMAGQQPPPIVPLVEEEARGIAFAKARETRTAPRSPGW